MPTYKESGMTMDAQYYQQSVKSATAFINEVSVSFGSSHTFELAMCMGKVSVYTVPHSTTRKDSVTLYVDT